MLRGICGFEFLYVFFCGFEFMVSGGEGIVEEGLVVDSVDEFSVKGGDFFV